MVNIYRTTVLLSGGINGAGTSTMHWGVAGTASADAAAISSAVNTFWDTLKGYIGTGLLATLSPELETIDTATGRLVDVDPMTGWTVTANDTGEPLPHATQGLLRWRTGVQAGEPSKEIRGRTFIPYPMEGRSTGGMPVALYVTNANNAAAALIANASTVLLTYSPKNLTAAEVTSGTCWGKWASLRSRRD